MSDVDDLVTWLRAQLDEDERLATNGGKLSGDQWSALEISPGRVTWEVVRRGRGVVAEAVQWEAEHIARHDPARVLAEVDAKRRILELYDVSTSRELKPDAWELMKHAVRALALPYAARPGYRDEWKP